MYSGIFFDTAIGLLATLRSLTGTLRKSRRSWRIISKRILRGLVVWTLAVWTGFEDNSLLIYAHWSRPTFQRCVLPP